MSFWRGKKVVVTGGTGFVGSFLVEELLRQGAKVRVPTRSKKNATRFLKNALADIDLVEVDLNDSEKTKKIMQGNACLMHLAAQVGGIEYNMAHPASIFRDNISVFLNCLEAARLAKMERVMITSSACVYPRIVPIPTPESEGFNGRPEETNEAYGWAKRMQEFMGQSYSQEYGMSIGVARPYNCYGPRDNFNPQSSHVIPALIRRIWKTKERPLKVWGSGQQSRSFLYVEDFVAGLMQVAEKAQTPEPLNLGRDEETTIAQLVEMLSQIHQQTHREKVPYIFDTARPEGQPRRHCDVSKAKKSIGFEAKVDLQQGLLRTVEWYLEEGMPDA
ncbi:MAG: NAD-dependent epimerase/dehydratase family protein [Bdellovibrionales bacterium]